MKKLSENRTWKEFKEFIAQGNILDMAISFVMGTAFKAIVTSLVDNILMPLLGIAMGGKDFSTLSFTIGNESVAYGMFLQSIIDFLIIAICLFFFAFSTIISWYFFGEVNVKALLGTKFVKFYAIIALGFIVLGSSLKVDLVWNISDMFNGLMVLPNLLALLALSGVVVAIAKSKESEK